MEAVDARLTVQNEVKSLCMSAPELALNQRTKSFGEQSSLKIDYMDSTQKEQDMNSLTDR